MFNKELKKDIAEIKEELRTVTIKVNVLLNEVAKIKVKKNSKK